MLVQLICDNGNLYGYITHLQTKKIVVSVIKNVNTTQKLGMAETNKQKITNFLARVLKAGITSTTQTHFFLAVNRG